MTPQARSRKEWLKRKINAAKAERGMSWGQIAEAWSGDGHAVSASSLMSKHSRSSFTAVELVLLLQILEVPALAVPLPRRPEAAAAAMPVESGRGPGRGKPARV